MLRFRAHVYRPSRVTERTGRLLGTLVWLVAVIAIAFGAAGLTVAMQPSPDRPATSELTSTGDRAVGAHLDAAEASVADLADSIDALGTQARGALAAMVGGETDTMATAIAAGDALMARVKADSAAIRAELARAPYLGTALAPLYLSRAVQARADTLQQVAAAADGLDRPWARLRTGGAAAAQLSGQLAEHDQLVGVAAGQGRDAKYKDAIKTIDQATTVLKAAHAARDRLANSVDVTTLDQWLERNETYDAALRALYQLTPDVGKRVTAELKAAIAAEKAARARLPANSRGLVVIMADIGQGWVNGAVIAIEEAKATLAAALEPASAASPDPGTP
jgi:hypothetical protein